MNHQTKSSNKAKSGGIFMADTMTVQRTTAEMLDYMLNSDEHPVLINALPEESYIAKRIPGSVYVPVEKADLVEQIVPDKDQGIVVYCANADCDASSRLADILIEEGYSKVWDFEEGLEGWQEEGYTLTGHKTD